jgi:hypothetical protein
MPKQGVASTFKFGTAYGALLAVTALCEIPTHLVSPRKWKTHFALDSDKEKSRALAIRLWPGCGFFSRVKDHGRAEAALLARYGAEVVEMASIALQHGVPVETIRRALLRDPQGRASSPLGTALDAIAEAGP